MQIFALLLLHLFTPSIEASEIDNEPTKVNLELGLGTGIGYRIGGSDRFKFIGTTAPIFIGVRWDKVSLRMPINRNFFPSKQNVSLAVIFRVVQFSDNLALTSELGIDHGKFQETHSEDESIRTNRVHILIGLERWLHTQPKGFFSWSGIGLGLDGDNSSHFWLGFTPMLKGGFGYAF